MTGTDHARRRFCERVLNLAENEIYQYLKDCGDEVEAQLVQMAEHSFFFWRGVMDDYPEHDYYYHKGGFVFITDATANIVTLYEVIYLQDPDADRKAAGELLRKITRLQGKLSASATGHEEKVAKKDMEIGAIGEIIRSLQDQIAVQEARLNKVVADRDLVAAEREATEYEIGTLAYKLINSMAYRMDLLVARKGSGNGQKRVG